MNSSVKRICLSVAFLILLAVPAHSADKTVTLKWDANSENDLAGYRIFYKEYDVVSFDYSNPIWEGTETTCIVAVPSDGQFVARAFDIAGNESGDSNVAVLDDPPDSVKGLLIQAIRLGIQALEKLNDAIAQMLLQ